MAVNSENHYDQVIFKKPFKSKLSILINQNRCRHIFTFKILPFSTQCYEHRQTHESKQNSKH